MTLFPEIVYGSMNYSIFGRAMENGIVSLECVNIRDFAYNKHKSVDDEPYGGGVGMVMKPEPIYEAYSDIKKRVKDGTRCVFMSPAGKVFNQQIAQELSQEEDIILLCGHYEGIDQRVIDEIVTDEISIGDYILTGGELAAMTVMDAVSRLIPGVLGKQESFMTESFSDNLLEYPQYTRPRVFMGKEVPEVLLSGHHENIRKWRHQESVRITNEKRPEMGIK